MQEPILLDHRCALIRQQRKREVQILLQLGGSFRRIDADREDSDALLLEVRISARQTGEL
jgi:hypothetical protein